MANARKQKLVRHHVKEWRKDRGLTQEMLAERVERSRGLIAQIESGETALTEDVIYAMADAFDIQAGALLDIDPKQEGEIAHMLALLRGASPEQQRQVLAVVETMLRTDIQG